MSTRLDLMPRLDSKPRLDPKLCILLSFATLASTASAGPGAETYHARRLVSDGSAPAPHVDANLQNPWGIAFAPEGDAWVADNHTNRLTRYDGRGFAGAPAVTVTGGAPTGIVHNPYSTFDAAPGERAALLVATEEGTIDAWSPAVSPGSTLVVVDTAGTKVFTGLAIGADGERPLLYAADFLGGRVAVYDGDFQELTQNDRFLDPNLPSGFAPFGIQYVQGLVVVAYAMHEPGGSDEVPGPGLGIVDAFDGSGHGFRRLASGGALNAPWGLALAPPSFGPFAGRLLVGNFGDGRIHAFDATDGAFVGTLERPDGAGVEIEGLWGIAFGNGTNLQQADVLFFAAGIDDEAGGLYGRIAVNP